MDSQVLTAPKNVANTSIRGHRVALLHAKLINLLANCHELASSATEHVKLVKGPRNQNASLVKPTTSWKTQLASTMRVINSVRNVSALHQMSVHFVLI